MKKRNVRTRKKYITENGEKKTKFVVEIKVHGVWRQGYDGDRNPLIFDCCYDANAKLLSAFERGVVL
jgi:hypothetical protein